MDQELQRNLVSRNGGFEPRYFRGLSTPFSFSLTRLASCFNFQHQSFEDYDDVVYSDHGYSRPIVFLDVIWNLAFVVVSCFVLLTTIGEHPSTPLRLWIGGYALQCLLHVGFIWVEFQRRSFDDFDDVNFDGGSSFSLSHSSIMKRLESVNTVISSIWWVFGFYWIVMGGQALLQDSPRLYWLSVVFLAFDVFFMIFCIAMGFVVFFAFCCFFPFIATVAYAMKLGDGASESDIKTLPKYRYGRLNTSGNLVNMTTGEDNLISQLNCSDSVPELALQPDDSTRVFWKQPLYLYEVVVRSAYILSSSDPTCGIPGVYCCCCAEYSESYLWNKECCICLYKYVDGAELCVLPCNHHFHNGCISKWLRINATCPLCKFNILRGDTLV